MSDNATSTIAQLLFVKQPELNFAHVVSELDSALARYPADRRALSWDCDDVAVFDLDGSRIVLGYADDLQGAHRACLSVSVGRGPTARVNDPLARRRGTLCRMITERISSRYPIDAILWHEIDRPVTPEMIDQMTDDLPPVEASPVPGAPATGSTAVDIDRLMARMSVELETRMAQPSWEMIDDQDIVRVIAMPTHPTPRAAKPVKPTAKPSAEPTSEPTATQPPASLANDTPDLPMPMLSDLARVRLALYPVDPEAERAKADVPSNSVRLTVHCMNATIIMVSGPIGVAVMLNSILRGEDLRFSGRLMALTGAILAIGHSSLGQSMISAMMI